MKQIFLNIPVADLEKSKNFYAKLGFTNYQTYTGDNQVCMTWSDQILVMLQSKSFFNLGNGKSIAETTQQLSATFTLPVESIKMVNEIVENGLKAGGKEPFSKINEDFMLIRAIEDLDGQIWSFIHLDINKYNKIKNNG